MSFSPTSLSASSRPDPQNGIVRIASSVEAINANCYKNCKSLEEVIFTNDSKLRHIGRNAFKKSGLKKIRIPREVETLGDECFEGSTFLAEVISADDSKLRRIGNRTFEISHLTSITIPG